MIVARPIKGTISKLRGWARFVLLFLYLVVPWFNYAGRPAVMLDIAGRRTYLPGAVFWPQEVYYLILILGSLGISLFLFTSMFGRLWCGWACPQTVYTELFDFFGRLVMPDKFGKKSETGWQRAVVHIIWVILSAVLTFHFIAYFVGARFMLSSIVTMKFGIFANYVWPYFWVATTGLFYFDLGFFREQFCVYLCPYARFQSVMLDRNSIVVAYDKHRGEPRREKGQKLFEEGNGDCTNCQMCTLVCPTGIDIRNGLQVACINCGHCIDACNNELARFGKKSLVDYASTVFFEERKKPKIFRPRTILYSGIFVAALSTFAILLVNRVPLHLSVLRDRNVPPVNVEGVTQNYYKVDIANMTEHPVDVVIETKSLDPSVMSDIEEIVGENPIRLEANTIRPINVVLRGKGKETHASAKKIVRIEFTVRDAHNAKYAVTRQTLFTIL